jgi:hypothetical protein
VAITLLSQSHCQPEAIKKYSTAEKHFLEADSQTAQGNGERRESDNSVYAKPQVVNGQG